MIASLALLLSFFYMAYLFNKNPVPYVVVLVWLLQVFLSSYTVFDWMLK